MQSFTSCEIQRHTRLLGYVNKRDTAGQCNPGINLFVINFNAVVPIMYINVSVFFSDEHLDSGLIFYL